MESFYDRSAIHMSCPFAKRRECALEEECLSDDVMVQSNLRLGVANGSVSKVADYVTAMGLTRQGGLREEVIPI